MSTFKKPVYKLIIQPKIATEIPATIIVVVPVPSHTINNGARADLGRLFKITRYGSITKERVLENHKAVAVARLIRITRKKLIIVSYSVIPICVIRDLSISI